MDRATLPSFNSVGATGVSHRRWVLRAIAALLVGFSLAYATLPLWLPTERVRLQLESQLTSDLGTPVRIGSVRVGWLAGVVIEDMVITFDEPQSGAGLGATRRGFARMGGTPGEHCLARIGHIRCDLAPVSLALGQKIRVLEISDPQIWLEIDRDGQLVLPNFNENKDARLPSFNYAVRNLVCHVTTPQVTQSFRIDRLDLQLDPPSGLLHLTSATRVARPAPDADEPAVGRLDFDANIRIPRLKKSEALNGNIEVEWSDLALNDLPVPLISRVPVEQVDGTTSGRLAIQTHPDLGIDYAVAIALNGVGIMRPDLNRPARVPDAELTCRGHWDPSAGLMIVHEMSCETPALKLEGPGGNRPAVRLEENGDQPAAVCVKGQVKDWAGLRGEIPEFDQLARVAGAVLDGTAAFQADWSRGRRGDRLVVEVSGEDSDCRVGSGTGRFLDLPAGVRKEMKIELIHEPAVGRWHVPTAEMHAADVDISASGEVVVPDFEPPTPESVAAGLSTAFTSARGRVRARCGDVEQLRRLVPWLGERPEIDAWAGPLEIEAEIEPQGTWSRCMVAAALASESQLRSGDLIQKREGRPLAIRAEARIPYAAAGQVDLLNLQLRHGAGRLELSSTNGSLEYDLGFTESADGPVLARADGSWRAELNVKSTEDLVALSPRASNVLKQSGISFLAGDVEVEAVSRFSYRPGDAILANRWHVIADGLAVRFDDRLTKRADEPLSVYLVHDFRVGTDVGEHCWAATVVQPAGRISGMWVAGERGPDVDGFEMLQLEVGFDELGELFAYGPQLTERIGVAATGDLSATLRQVRVGDRATGDARLDCTRAGLDCSRKFGASKAPGIPMTLEVGWEVAPAENSNTERALRITDLKGELAGTRIDRLNATLAPASASVLQGGRLALPNGTVEVEGTVALNETLASIHPALREWLQETGAAGRLGWKASVAATPGSVAVNVAFDATDTAFDTADFDGSLPRIRKQSGDPVLFTVDADAPRGKAGFAGKLDVRQAILRLGDNSVAVSGDMNPDTGPRGEPTTSYKFEVAADLPRLEHLRPLMPALPLETLAGGVVADVSVRSAGGAPEVTAGHVGLNEVAIGPAERPLRLDGSFTIAPAGANIEQIDFAWGESSGTFSGVVAEAGGRYEARIGFGGRTIQVEDLLARVEEFKTRLAGEPTSETQASLDVDPVERIIGLLRRAEATVDAHADTVTTPLPLGIKATLDAGWQQLRVQNGGVEMDFGCLVDGGRVDGKVTANLAVSAPTYRLTYTADRIQPGAVVDAYLRRTFPGMIAKGPLTLIDETVQKLLPAPGEPNPEVGKGELIIDGGTVSGRAAPTWMARIFPGLNLASFEFSRMHSWFDKTPDARVHHQMIYQGDYYNVYMIGWSNPEGFFEYEVGIDFLAGLESEYWANSGQGRVPLFTKTGCVLADGSLRDETVDFVSLRRVLETLFVQNNPLVTGYHAVRKRVLGKN